MVPFPSKERTLQSQILIQFDPYNSTPVTISTVNMQAVLWKVVRLKLSPKFQRVFTYFAHLALRDQSILRL